MCNTTLQTYVYIIQLFTKNWLFTKKGIQCASIVQYNELSKAKCVLCHYTVRTVYTIHCTAY